MDNGPKYHVPSYFRIMMKLNTLLGIYYYAKLFLKFELHLIKFTLNKCLITKP